MTAHPTSYPKAVLVTGAARRIGREIALGLADDGWDVAVHCRTSRTQAEEVAEAIRAKGRRAAVLPADLAQGGETEGLVDRAVAELGPLGCLVNNASTFRYDNLKSLTRESWDHHIEANLWAPLVLTQAFARQLPEEAGGVVINLLDQRLKNLTPNFVSYTVSKAGLWTLTRMLAISLAPRIRVNGIGPGYALPDFTMTEEEFERQAARTPLAAPTSPAEVTEAVRYILKAPSMTGQMIVLDGGQHLGWSYPGKRRKTEKRDDDPDMNA